MYIDIFMYNLIKGFDLNIQRIDFLSAIPLFQGLADQELEVLSQSAIERSYTAGQCLANDSDSSETLFLVQEGRVRLTKTSYAGKEQTLHIFGPGDLVGLFSLFTGASFPASAIALEESRMLLFSRERLELAAQRIPSLLINLFHALAMRHAECIRTVENLSLKETPQRLAAFLLLESKKAGNAFALSLAYSHRELAKILGTTPETLSRVLSRFIQNGLVTQEGRVIHILDHQGLRNIDGGCIY